jgi:hypothetical protein
MSNMPIELTVSSHHDDHSRYQVSWSDGSHLIVQIPEIWLGLISFMSARALLEQGYKANRVLVIRLQGADYDLVSAPLGAVAATPLINYANPVKQSTRQYGQRYERVQWGKRELCCE